MLGSIEAGGTKFVCAVSDEEFNLIDKISFLTTDPKSTLKEIFNFFDKYEDIKSIGIGSFGPININKNSDKYGYITSTPKTKWKNFNFLGEMKKHYNIPISWTTDVNAACLGEYYLGSAKGSNSCIYLTIGTGIGGGVIINGDFMEGFSHPEMGHILIKKHVKDKYEGFCPYHGDCLEGLTAGPSIEKRYGVSGKKLDKDHEVWKFISYYLAQALVNYTLIIRPEKIILGGGVMNQDHMLSLVKKEFKSLLSDYVEVPNIDDYIVKPLLKDNAGIIGGLVLASKECGYCGKTY